MATLFFSYSHKDEDLRDQLEIHLAAIKHEGLISTWHDRRILAGDEFDKAIDAEMETADVILLLVSPDFIASRYCYHVEVTKAIQRHELGLARVIPVILRPCDWRRTLFGRLLAAPKDGKAVTRWPDRDEAFLDVAEHIRAAVGELTAAEVRPKHAPNEAVENSPETRKTTENRFARGSSPQPFKQKITVRTACIIFLASLVIGAGGLLLKNPITRVLASLNTSTSPTPVANFPTGVATSPSTSTSPTPVASFPTGVVTSSSISTAPAPVASFQKGLFSLESKATDLVMTITRLGVSDLLVQSVNNHWENQIWTTVFADEGYCYLLTKYSANLRPEQCLEVVPSPPDLDHLGLRPRRSGVDAQLWKFREVEPGYYMITSKSTGGAIDVPWGQEAEGLPLILYRAHGGDNQLWKVVDRK